MLSAIINGTKTMSVVETLGRMSRNRMRWRGNAETDGGEHEFACRSDSTWPRIGRAT